MPGPGHLSRGGARTIWAPLAAFATPTCAGLCLAGAALTRILTTTGAATGVSALTVVLCTATLLSVSAFSLRWAGGDAESIAALNGVLGLRADAGATRRLVAGSLLFAAVVFAALMTFASALSPIPSGTIVLVDSAQSFFEEAPVAGIHRNLGVELSLKDADAAAGSLTIKARDIAGGVDATTTLQPGERARARGVVLALESLRPRPESRLVRVDVTSRATGSTRSLRLSSQQPQSLDDGTEIVLIETTTDYLGALGAAARLELRHEGETRRVWAFAEGEGFDRDHGAGQHYIELVGIEYPVAATLHARLGVGRSLMPAGGVGVAFAALLSVVSLSRRRRAGNAGAKS